MAVFAGGGMGLQTGMEQRLISFGCSQISKKIASVESNANRVLELLSTHSYSLDYCLHRAYSKVSLGNLHH